MNNEAPNTPETTPAEPDTLHARMQELRNAPYWVVGVEEHPDDGAGENEELYPARSEVEAQALLTTLREERPEKSWSKRQNRDTQPLTDESNLH